jgi:tetratricopeptide (TPR) repeat protein
MRLFGLFALSSLLALASLPAMAQLLPPALKPVEELKIPEVSKEDQLNPDQPQFLSLAGNALFGLKDKDGEIAKKRKEVEENATDPNQWIQLGLLEDSYMRHRDAIKTYSEGLAKFPNDWRFLRYRGQRHISGRQFREAIEDLEAARQKTKKSYEVAYYLGIAYYFSGEFAKAAAEFGRCEAQMAEPVAADEMLYDLPTCEGARESYAYRVALSYWKYLALKRGGEDKAAKAYAESISPLWTLTANKAFYDVLLYFRGTKELAEMMVGANEATRDYLTRSSAVAAFDFAEGERQKACAIWQRNAMDPKWNHLGVIAAEVEYYSLSKAACALYGLGDAKPAN